MACSQSVVVVTAKSGLNDIGVCLGSAQYLIVDSELPCRSHS
jgi:hypothetical protein